MSVVAVLRFNSGARAVIGVLNFAACVISNRGLVDSHWNGQLRNFGPDLIYLRNLDMKWLKITSHFQQHIV